MIRMLTLCAAVTCSVPASANWNYEASEGGYYAWSTDGGFVENSFKNGLFLQCPDISPADLNPGDNRHRSILCEFRVTLDGQIPRPPAIVTFAFDDGTVIQAITERIQGRRPQIALEGELLDAMLAKKSVVVSANGLEAYEFSLSGSSSALRQAMGLPQ